MDIGISTACFYPMYTEDTISIISDLGAGLCEVFFEADCEYSDDFTKLISEKMEMFGVKANSVHAFCANFENQLFSDYERRRNDALITFRSVLKGAKAVGATSYTFHGDKRSDSLEDVDFGHCARCFDLLADMASGYGIQLGWENVVRNQSSRPEFIKRVKEMVKSDNLKFTLDIKQARRANIPLDEYISAMGEDIVNVHINDFNDKCTCLLPGEGDVNFKEFFDKLKKINYKGNAIIEVYSADFTDLSELKKSFEYMKAAGV